MSNLPMFRRRRDLYHRNLVDSGRLDPTYGLPHPLHREKSGFGPGVGVIEIDPVPRASVHRQISRTHHGYITYRIHRTSHTYPHPQANPTYHASRIIITHPNKIKIKKKRQTPNAKTQQGRSGAVRSEGLCLRGRTTGLIHHSRKDSRVSKNGKRILVLGSSCT
ncbi:hypothetical protein BDZ94DRAFT_406202 [Collybia nuda]|uniref:Uncharacterized protein n=1 Tax=Collybia nuda TaxID=64659 RepID=A0A9P6CLN7_9AGAR|nr:hypothetical protein BDZ94DRAFT_406202 [Collybia nuda]